MQTQLSDSDMGAEVTPTHLDAEACWQAVLRHDARCDGAFVYGVVSTRIFCRPSCPARRPQRDHARFFTTAEGAIQEGYRPCKRCRPEQALAAPVERVQQACRLIEEHLDTPLTLAELSRQIGGSPFHLQRTFKQVTGITPREYADALRLGRVKAGLQAGESVLHALYDAGYGSSRGLYERAATQMGMTPATYGRGGQGANINFRIVACPLGFLLIAATSKGLCAVSLGDDPAALEADLRRDFSAAELRQDEDGIEAWTQTLLRYLDAQEPHLDLPLDVRATAFQWRVWQVLRSIGYGETRSYTQVAEAIGQPTAARAVARACATNPVALTIPCHRVVRGSGELSGYRWGLERKKALLARERGQ